MTEMGADSAHGKVHLSQYLFVFGVSTWIFRSKNNNRRCSTSASYHIKQKKKKVELQADTTHRLNKITKIAQKKIKKREKKP